MRTNNLHFTNSYTSSKMNNIASIEVKLYLFHLQQFLHYFFAHPFS